MNHLNRIKTGNQYGDLTVIKFDSYRKNRGFYLCQCKCGNEVVRRSDSLKDNSTCKKCKAEKQSKRMTSHGETNTHLYTTWRSVKNRVFSKDKTSSYVRRGITMYEPWINSYELFRDYVLTLEHCNEKGYTLDRINNDGNYEPNNLRWATSKEQSRNRSDNHLITFDGKTMILRDWAKEKGLKVTTLQNRLYSGWNIKDALEKPVI